MGFYYNQQPQGFYYNQQPQKQGKWKYLFSVSKMIPNTAKFKIFDLSQINDVIYILWKLSKVIRNVNFQVSITNNSPRKVFTTISRMLMKKITPEHGKRTLTPPPFQNARRKSQLLKWLESWSLTIIALVPLKTESLHRFLKISHKKTIQYVKSFIYQTFFIKLNHNWKIFQS